MAVALFLAFTIQAAGQNNPAVEAAPAKADTVVAENPVSKEATPKRAFGVLPNYRFAEGQAKFEPITSRQKFRIAWKDSTDWPVFPTALFFTGLYQMENQNPSFGQGLKGFSHRFATAYTDQVIGNYLIEAIIPTALHTDPRYFRLGHHSVPVRLGWAVSRLLITRTDSGRYSVNAGELGGNAAQIAIANSYYPDTRTVVKNYQRMILQMGTDGLGNVLKEFWPDVRRKLAHRQAATTGL